MSSPRPGPVVHLRRHQHGDIRGERGAEITGLDQPQFMPLPQQLGEAGGDI